MMNRLCRGFKCQDQSRPVSHNAMGCPEFVTLHTGAKMPILGYGTWQAKEGELEDALEKALSAGYRHIDTAATYDNEHIIGKLIDERWIKTGKMTREELFMVTKLPPSGNFPGGPERWLKRSLEKLRLDYVDVYLIHLPIGFREGDDLLPMDSDGKAIIDYTVDHVAVWKEMEAQVDAGRTKAIGLSNFNKRQIQQILDIARIKPANLQVELHVYMQQKPLVEFCHENGIAVTAYSPIGSPGSATFFNSFGNETTLPDLIRNPTVVEIADKHNKKPGQILLRHIVQRGIIAIPKSLNEERIIQNIQLFDFRLDNEDMEKLNALDQGKDGRILDFTFFGATRDSPAYPFNEYP